MADVLIVDDDPDVLRLVSVLVERLGHAARTAPTAEDALMASAEQRADLMLLDLNLPGLQGDEFIGWLDRGIGRPRRLVIMSARPAREVRDVARRFDAGHLHKPFSPERFNRVVEKALAGLEEGVTVLP